MRVLSIFQCVIFTLVNFDVSTATCLFHWGAGKCFGSIWGYETIAGQGWGDPLFSTPEKRCFFFFSFSPSPLKERA